MYCDEIICPVYGVNSSNYNSHGSIENMLMEKFDNFSLYYIIKLRDITDLEINPNTPIEKQFVPNCDSLKDVSQIFIFLILIMPISHLITGLG